MPATMLPPTFNDPRPNRDAERHVYHALQRQLPASVTVFHDCAWVSPPPVRRTPFVQIDFIIGIPKWGIVVLEVKGGSRIGQEDGRWYVETRTGRREYYKLSPYQQAHEAAFKLLRTMREASNDQFPSNRIVHAICFPEIDVLPHTLDGSLDRALIIDRGDLLDIPAALRRIRDYWREMNVLRPGPLGSEWVAAIREHLARDMHLAQQLAVSLQLEQREIESISEEQANIYYAAARDRRLAVAGCAGSGKTLLAVMLARKLAADGHRVLLCCYNRPLAYYLSTMTAATPDIRVATFHSICAEIAASIQVAFDATDPNAIPQHLLPALQSEPSSRLRRYDAIVVDEGQDMDPAWWEVIEYLQNDPERNPIFVFYDDNQRIYDRPPGLPLKMRTMPLSTNFRNPRPVHEHVLYFYRNVPQPFPSIRQGTAPRFLPYDSQESGSLARALQRILTDLQAHHIPAEQIVILTPRGVASSALSTLEAHLHLRNGQAPGYIEWQSIYAFKGLERPVVIVAELDAAIEYQSQLDTLLYIAYSRASSQLIVLHDQAIQETAL